MATSDVRTQIMEVLSSPMDLPSTFWDYATQSWLKDAPVFPISQVFGFTQFAANLATVNTFESTSSTTYTDLATVGPSLSNLPDGNYILLYGVTAFMGDAVNNFLAAPQVNSTAASDVDWALGSGSVGMGVSRATVKALSNSGSSTVTLRYRVTGGTGSFENRWLIALKISNL